MTPLSLGTEDVALQWLHHQRTAPDGLYRSRSLVWWDVFHIEKQAVNFKGLDLLDTKANDEF